MVNQKELLCAMIAAICAELDVGELRMLLVAAQRLLRVHQQLSLDEEDQEPMHEQSSTPE